MWRAAALALLAAGLTLAPESEATADGTGVVSATVTVAGELTIEVVVPDRKVQTGNPFHVEARITAAQAGIGVVAVRHPDGLLLRGPDSVLVTLRPGRATVVRWSACAETPGLHVLMASFEGAPGHVESHAEVVEITGKKRNACPEPWQ